MPCSLISRLVGTLAMSYIGNGGDFGRSHASCSALDRAEVARHSRGSVWSPRIGIARTRSPRPSAYRTSAEVFDAYERSGVWGLRRLQRPSFAVGTFVHIAEPEHAMGMSLE